MCSIITTYTNPQLTVFGDETLTKKKMKSGLYSKDSYNILIMNPPIIQKISINKVLNKIEKYIGTIDDFKCLKFHNEKCYALYIDFAHWYDNDFTRAVHRELIYAHQISSSYTDNHVKINIDGYEYEIILCKMKF